MKSQNDTAVNQNKSEYMIPETSSNNTKILIYRIACILLFISGIVFFTIYLIKSQYIITLHYPLLRNMDLMSIIIIAAMVIAVVCLIRTLKKTPVIKFISLIIAGVMLSATWYVYFRYFPKYGPLEACAIVKADPKYAAAAIEPHDRLYSYVEDNPFCNTGYILDVISDGKVTEWIMFDSTTGKYDFCEPEY